MPVELTFALATDYVVLMAHAVFCLWIGCNRALRSKSVENLTAHDAYMFPVIGSGVLVGLYLIIKWVNPALLSYLITCYFAFIGCFCVTQVLRPVIVSLFFSSGVPARKFKVPFIDMELDTADLIGLALLGLPTTLWWALTKHWIANNILGVCFAIEAISLVGLSSYWVGAVLLSGLFLYDIFWVFGTEVMVSVAKGFNAPIKIMFPRNPFTFNALLHTAGEPMSILGLGDIAIPGFFLSMLLKFDEFLFTSSNKSGDRSIMRRSNFNWGMIAYISGLTSTFVAMHLSDHAQPALLYLVPWCIATSLISALARGQFSRLIRFQAPEDTTDKTAVTTAPTSTPSLTTAKKQQ